VVEQDNPDSFPVTAVMLGVQLAGERGLDVVAKNPGLLKADAVTYVAHPDVVGIIVEKGGGSPGEMNELRRSADKPDLPVWFVSFKNGRSQAKRAAKEITSAGFINMGVTHSQGAEVRLTGFSD